MSKGFLRTDYTDIEDYCQIHITFEDGTDRQPKSGMLVASDTVAALYAAYVSAERRGAEVDVPIGLTLE